MILGAVRAQLTYHFNVLLECFTRKCVKIMQVNVDVLCCISLNQMGYFDWSLKVCILCENTDGLYWCELSRVKACWYT